MQKKTQPKTQKSARPLRVGFVPLCDCAPLVMAQELALFEKYGVDVELSREIGWATIRDKIIYGELDAAHAVAGLLFSCLLGIGSIPSECLTGLVLNLHGNAITLSTELREHGVRDAATLRREIERTRGRRLIRFGVAFPFSSHNFVLCEWLRLAGIDPENDVEIVSVPPPQMFPNLRAGNLDGYCVGEPWNSLAVMKRAGWCVATSGELAPQHPEKVLMVRRDFAERREPEHLALIAALLEACAFCDRPENRERIIETLALPEYVDAPIHALRMSMNGSFDFGHGRVEKDSNFHIFSRHNANEPTHDKGEWVLQQMCDCGVIADPSVIEPNCIADTFRADIFQQAKRLVTTTNNRSTK
ncbi:MAG: ABC transporter substrate-binding protein [Verrucomicrobiota bacterium]|nr:ABC transporter substrate-binding protein [Verrucomicrobiota bacterium]